ncbi:MAG: multidomain protein with s-layer y region, ig motif, i-set domain, pkd domain, partial [Bacteriovoracaceae bacterium]|nr:multidomain protein with s-layer y region, ig motif, i-set domain, pkd domain [Bacteriovoracaceae bacterium]
MILAGISPTPPTVIINESSQSVNQGVTVTFTSTVINGTAPFSYQWNINDAQDAFLSSTIFVPLPGQTGSSLTLNNIQETDAGYYSVTVTDSLGQTATSGAKYVYVNAPLSVQFTNPPSGFSVNDSSASFFTVGGSCSLGSVLILSGGDSVNNTPILGSPKCVNGNFSTTVNLAGLAYGAISIT